MADVKFSGFTDGNNVEIGDIVVGLRTGSNYKFDFPGDGIKDGNGNYLFKYATLGAGATNYIQISNGQSGTPTEIETLGSDTNIDLTISTKGSGKVNIAAEVDQLQKLDVDNIEIDGNTISSTNSGGDIVLSPLGDISASTNQIKNVVDPTAAQDAATKNYVDTTAGGAGGSNTEIQYNNLGTIDGDSGFTTNGAGSLTVTGDVSVDNLNLNANTISSTNTNGNITLAPNGTGVVLAGSDIDMQQNDLLDVRRLDFDTSWRVADESVGSIQRLLVRAQTGNAIGEVAVAPIGTATESRIILTNDPNLTNFAAIELGSDTTSQHINSAAFGSGTLLPLHLQMNGVDAFVVNTDESLSAQSNQVKDVANPTDAQDAVTLNYFDNNAPGAGGTTGEIQWNNAGTLDGDSITTDGAGNWAGTLSLTGQSNVDNLRFDGRTISTTDTNGNLILNPDGSGSILAKDTTSVIHAGGLPGVYQINQTDANPPISITRFVNAASSNFISMAHSRGASIGDNVILQNNDSMGSMRFHGNDGTGYAVSAQVIANVDGTPGVGVMPSKIRLQTADSAGTLLTALTVDSSQNTTLAGVLSGATQINVDNLRLDENTISSTDTNGNINFNPNGTGVVAVSGNFGVGLSAANIQRRVDVLQSDTAPLGIRVTNSTATSTNKIFKIGFRHYDTSEEDVMFASFASTLGATTIDIGGNSSQQNSATAIRFYLGATTTTTTGTEIGRFTAAGLTMFSGGITPVQTTGIIGTTTNNNANAGSVGETVTSTVSSGAPVNPTTATATNLTSLSLTAGDWDIFGFMQVINDASALTTVYGWFSQTSATLPSLTSRVGTIQPAHQLWAGALPPQRLSLSSTTTIYVGVYATYASGTTSASGIITARRRR